MATIILFAFFLASGASASSFLFPNLQRFEYYAGIFEAQQGNYELAERYLEAGWIRTGNAVFLPELAGVSYRLGKNEQTKKYLFQILQHDPDDAYANNFLGTIFLLDGNLEACLKYWNRIGKPLIEDIQVRSVLPIDPEIMDKAFAMAPASQLKLEDYLATNSRLQTMDLFRRYRYELRPYQDQEKFDLVFQPSIKRNSFQSKLKIAMTAGQAIFSDTIKPEFYNIGGTTMSSKSLISWDEFRNRYYTSLSLPLGEKPYQRIRLFTDIRKETWALENDLNLKKWEAGVELEDSINSRIQWRGGTKLSQRDYSGPASTSSPAFQQGWSIQVFGTVDDSLLRVPEKRITLNTTSNAELGKIPGASSFLTLEQSFDFRWFPHPKGDDLMISGRFQMGKIFGDAPFDEYFVLGVERDSDLMLRAHKSDIDKKGENPFAPAYLLWNWDISKFLIDKSLIRWRLSPFVDAAAISRSDLWNGNRWFIDTGIQSGFEVLRSVEFIFTYGKDLRKGRNVFYLNARIQ